MRYWLIDGCLQVPREQQDQQDQEDQTDDPSTPVHGIPPLGFLCTAAEVHPSCQRLDALSYGDIS